MECIGAMIATRNSAITADWRCKNCSVCVKMVAPLLFEENQQLRDENESLEGKNKSLGGEIKSLSNGNKDLKRKLSVIRMMAADESQPQPTTFQVQLPVGIVAGQQIQVQHPKRASS